jgi:serine/threonine protein kinase/formylglycine-generating enzyme required for sulfatase activity
MRKGRIMLDMSQLFPSHADAAWARREKWIQQFEDAWEQGRRPTIDEFLPHDPADRAEVLAELVHADLEIRLKSGESVQVEDYLERYPELEGNPEIVLNLIASEYDLRARRLPAPLPGDYVRRFPQFGSMIQRQLCTPASLATDPAVTTTAAAQLPPPPLREGPASETASGSPVVDVQTDQPDGDSRITRVEETPCARPPRQDPSQIGRYRIDQVLGEGSFGRVYLAHDDQLNRRVAIKVPHQPRLADPIEADAYWAEARVLAGLDHPNILPVYDVGTTPDGKCFVVSKLLEGSDLARRMKETRFSHHQAAELIATVAEALHHAHRKGLVHRDIKPANILLDNGGRPYVADFGLALREEDFGKGSGFAGTPAYMSPEQARGEGHRVDGRSDIFSLAVVFYELLVGRRPFQGPTVSELLEQITAVDTRPPRQIDDTVPRELERICLKALAKRASERYSTARDLADDLRHWQLQIADCRLQIDKPNAESSPRQSAICNLQSAIKIVPRGLRSFNAEDADFYLGLLPGTRDREGLPESIRFWKHRIGTIGTDHPFGVGVIYGPSGCGKSSLVKAGLLPRLPEQVISIYLEATPQATETQLAQALRKRFPALADNLSLKDALAAVRRGNWPPAGTKVLIVLDQFEQWLHAHKETVDGELVNALRQCDGDRVQCLVMVRDDFWMGVTRFLRELDIRLVEGHNAASVDLFDLDHATRVLAAFGRAFGRLPKDPPSREQQYFLRQAVSGLAQEGKVVCVRLALFAEMMKGKPWTPAALRTVGGAAGVGVAFLEETFCAAGARPRHRYHQRAARAVLQALLPETGADIKGHMRPQAELMEASGYQEPKDWEDLVHILDGEIRLITPTDPEGSGYQPAPSPALAQRYYQLTHDYLVPSVRDWLTRKQRETRRGRAALRLAQRTVLWQGAPETRHLPGWWEWLTIRLFTRQRSWTPAQKQLMGKAGAYHAVRAGLLIVCLFFLSWFVWDAFGRLQAQALCDRLLEATTADVPAIVKDMAPYRRWIDPLLRDAYRRAEANQDSRKQLHASLALLEVDPGQVAYLYGRLLRAEPHEVAVLREALHPYRDQMTNRLWDVLMNRHNHQDLRFRAACALASYAPDDPRWAQVCDDVLAKLAAEDLFVIAQWAEALRPVGRFLLRPLAGMLADEGRTGRERALLARLYATYADGQRDAFAWLEKALTQNTPTPVAPAARDALVTRRANLAVALLLMGRTDKVWPLLGHQADPTLRSLLIERLGTSGADPRPLVARLRREPDVAIRRAILLSLGQFGVDRLPLGERDNLVPELMALYRDDPDPGIHGAAEWLLRRWRQAVSLPPLARRVASAPSAEGLRWFINRQGLTMVIIADPKPFGMGEGPDRRRGLIPYPFAMASKEVTVAQFLRFRKDHSFNRRLAPEDDCPVNGVSWYQATAFCNWLSQQDGISPDQWCYLPNGKGQYDEGMRLAPDWPRRTGYRLPTEAEWEYACRAGTQTRYFWGDSETVISQYAWYKGNSSGRSHPVGLLKPNDLGLFDMSGNAAEWCLDTEMDDRKETRAALINDDLARVARGGAFDNLSGNVRSAQLSGFLPSYLLDNVSFRPVRTIRANRYRG